MENNELTSVLHLSKLFCKTKSCILSCCREWFFLEKNTKYPYYYNLPLQCVGDIESCTGRGRGKTCYTTTISGFAKTVSSLCNNTIKTHTH